VIRQSRAWGHTAVTFSLLRGSVLLLPTHTLAAAVPLMEGEYANTLFFRLITTKFSGLTATKKPDSRDYALFTPPNEDSHD